MYRGYIFSFDAILPDEDILTPQEIHHQLSYIEKWCSAQERDGPGIGALTVTDRSVWARNRKYLMALHPENEKNIKMIEGSIAVYAFEDSEPLTQTDVSARAEQRLGCDIVQNTCSSAGHVQSWIMDKRTFSIENLRI